MEKFFFKVSKNIFFCFRVWDSKIFFFVSSLGIQKYFFFRGVWIKIFFLFWFGISKIFFFVLGLDWKIFFFVWFGKYFLFWFCWKCCLIQNQFVSFTWHLLMKQSIEQKQQQEHVMHMAYFCWWNNRSNKKTTARTCHEHGILLLMKQSIEQKQQQEHVMNMAYFCWWKQPIEQKQQQEHVMNMAYFCWWNNRSNKNNNTEHVMNMAYFCWWKQPIEQKQQQEHVMQHGILLPMKQRSNKTARGSKNIFLFKEEEKKGKKKKQRKKKMLTPLQPEDAESKAYALPSLEHLSSDVRELIESMLEGPVTVRMPMLGELLIDSAGRAHGPGIPPELRFDCRYVRGGGGAYKCSGWTDAFINRHFWNQEALDFLKDHKLHV